LKICMFVYNNMTHDSRVMKEAKTLAQAGHDVRVIAVLDKVTKPYQEMDGFRIIRVVKKPFHYKIIKLFKGILYIPRLIKSLLFDPVARLLSKITKGLKRAYYSINPDTDDKEMNGRNRSMTKARSVCSFALHQLVLAIYYTCCFIHKITNSIYCGIRKNIIRVNAFLRSILKGFLMIFHRSLCFVDYYFRSFRLVKEEPADIYHAHDLNTLPVAYWAQKKTGGKLVYDSHELYVERNTLKKQTKLAKFILTKIELFLVKSTDHIITVSESIAQELKEKYPVKRPSVILNAPKGHIDISNLYLSDELRIPKDKKIVLYVGNVTFNRGLEELIRSIVYLDHCVVVIMGRVLRPEYGKELKRLARKIGVEDKVYYFGPVPSENVTGYASSAHVGAAPIKNVCLSYYYCLPNKLFEYMVAGLPVVGSNFPELTKVINEYNLGKTFDPNDPKDIAQAINYVLVDKTRYEQMKKNAAKASKVFNWENESKKLLEIYKTFEDEFYSTSN